MFKDKNSLKKKVLFLKRLFNPFALAGTYMFNKCLALYKTGVKGLRIDSSKTHLEDFLFFSVQGKRSDPLMSEAS